jgi:hypothetical protein
MSKKTLVIVGILIFMGVIAAWVYVLVNGPTDANNGDSFTQFGDGGDSGYVPPPDNQMITDVRVEENPAEKRLRQLTTNPVAGAVFAENGIYYVEQGTGHLRHINLVTGSETLVSGKTIPGAYEAIFSSDGGTVAITTTQNGMPKTIVAEVPSFGSTSNLEGESLTPGASEIDLSKKAGVVFYLVESANGSTGYSYDIAKRTGTVVFEIPLRDVHVLWGDKTYVYTTPTERQTGYVYEIVGNDLRYVTRGGIGLMSFPYHDGVIVTRKERGYWSSESVSSSGEETLMLTLVPEKCTSGATNLFCALPLNLDSLREFPDSWYKGTVSSSDLLWQINIDTSVALLSDFLQESGREIDVLKIGINSLESHLFFINKNDNTLWLYRLPE